MHGSTIRNQTYTGKLTMVVVQVLVGMVYFLVLFNFADIWNLTLPGWGLLVVGTFVFWFSCFLYWTYIDPITKEDDSDG